MVINKRQGIGDAIKYLNRNFLTLKRYLRTYYNRANWDIIESFFWKNPVQASIILDDFKMNNDSKIRMVFEILHSAFGLIVYIIGAKGGGKTCTAFFLAENENLFYPNRNIYYVGRFFDKGALPSWCKWLEKLQEVPNGSLAIIDELGLQASARNFAKKENKDFSGVLQLARQKKIGLIVLSQDAKLGEVNVWRMRDIVIWKISNTYEMGGRGDRSSSESNFWDKVKYLMKARGKNECLFEYPAKRTFIHFTHELPKCWNDNLSEIYRDMSFIEPIQILENKSEEKDDF